MIESHSFVYESIFLTRLTGQMVLGGILMRHLFMSDVTNPRAGEGARDGWWWWGGSLLNIYCRLVS